MSTRQKVHLFETFIQQQTPTTQRNEPSQNSRPLRPSASCQAPSDHGSTVSPINIVHVQDEPIDDRALSKEPSVKVQNENNATEVNQHQQNELKIENIRQQELQKQLVSNKNELSRQEEEFKLHLKRFDLEKNQQF